VAIAASLVAVGLYSAGRARPGTVSIEGERVSARGADGLVLADAARAVDGSVLPATGSARVVVELESGDTLNVQAPDLGTADAILERLGLGLDRRALRLGTHDLRATTVRALGAAFFTMFASSLVLGLAVGGGAKPPGWSVPVWLFTSVAAAIGAVAATRPATVEVGLDGVAIRRRGRTRFTAYADVKAVELQGPVVRVVRTDGTAEVVGTQSEDRASAIVRRIEQARSGERAPAPTDVLARAGRTVSAWRDELRRWAAGATSFRSATLDDSDLAHVLEDPGATDELRLGAALALRERGPEARARVRVAAEATVSPRMRVALDKLGDEADLEDAALEEAIADAAAPAQALRPPTSS
jgi:hypothetical protein